MTSIPFLKNSDYGSLFDNKLFYRFALCRVDHQQVGSRGDIAEFERYLPGAVDFDCGMIRRGR